MSRSAALVTTWAQPARGREGKAIEAFTDYLTFWGKLAADGKVQEAEPFFSADGGRGFAIVRGSSDVLQEVMETDEYDKLISKAQLCVDGLHAEVYYTGDQIQRAMQIYAEAGHELGFI